jgi:hypothetical protein
MTSRTKVIEAIQEINRSAARDWLESFDTGALRHYLDHLEITLEPRGRRSIWVRPPGPRPAVTRTPKG